MQGELATVDKTNMQVESFARTNFHPDCEAAINEQIKCVLRGERARRRRRRRAGGGGARVSLSLFGALARERDAIKPRRQRHATHTHTPSTLRTQGTAPHETPTNTHAHKRQPT